MIEEERLRISGEYESIDQFLEIVDRLFEFLYLDVSQQYDTIVENFQQLIHVYAPLRQTG